MFFHKFSDWSAFPFRFVDRSMRRNLLPFKNIRSNSENSFHHRSLPDGSHKTKTTTVSIRMKMEWLRERKVIMKIQNFGHLQDVVQCTPASPYAMRASGAEHIQ